MAGSISERLICVFYKVGYRYFERFRVGTSRHIFTFDSYSVKKASTKKLLISMKDFSVLAFIIVYFIS